MGVKIAIAVVLELISTTLINLAYVREQHAAAALPSMSLHRPLQSLHLLLTNRSWLSGFAEETSGFLLFVAALALAPLAIVQSVGAGGLGVLAYASARSAKRPLRRHEELGAAISVLGLIALAISLIGHSSGKATGSAVAIVIWLGVTAALALLMIGVGRRLVGTAVAYGIAGGLLFSIGDISTKVTTEGGARFAFAIGLIVGYALGTSLLQLGYQKGGALVVAGIATLLTNALPIAASTIVLDEPVPPGILGALQVFAFVAVIVGAIALARPDHPAGSPPTGSASAGGATAEPGASAGGAGARDAGTDSAGR